MKPMLRFFTLLSLAFGGPLSFAGLYGQTLDSARTSQLDALFPEYDRMDRPVLVVCIVQQGALIYSKAFGMANLETRTVFTPETVSDIGSVAKQITCMAIVLLEQQGKLSFDDDIRAFFPGLPDFGTPITIRHLVHHTSGLREIYAMLELGGWIGGDGIRQEDALTMVSHLKELNFKPGDQYAYCNTAYMLLGEIIQRAGGKPYEAWMREHIFEPLGMRQTYVMDIQGELFPNCAESYGGTGPDSWVKIYDNSTAFGQGGIYTTLPDLAKWADNFRTGKVGGESGLRQMAQRGVLNSGDTLRYAFGIEHGRHGNLALLQHSGASAGYRAMLTYVPEQGLAIVMKANFAGFNSELFNQKVLQILFPEEQKSGAGATPAQKISKPEELRLSAEQLAAYAGTYFCPELESYYRIRVDGGRLILNQRRLGDFILKPEEADRFVSSSGFNLQFERDKKSRLTGFRISNSRVLRLWVEKQKE